MKTTHQLITKCKKEESDHNTVKENISHVKAAKIVVGNKWRKEKCALLH